ncbi:uncharacterized protein LOC115085291 isoform X2 [Rhinatrema bivittatum]|uniref:uncharacterized protein LOC115085291 isoform X2 n=1 Tax=Rhinatrema bivittatum TaxID=194408 RepID=UPI00112DAD40|nr:uncharacterized protein LOC115085291 isoform X2 [Rhinatrema bivittatum]
MGFLDSEHLGFVSPVSLVWKLVHPSTKIGAGRLEPWFRNSDIRLYLLRSHTYLQGNVGRRIKFRRPSIGYPPLREQGTGCGRERESERERERARERASFGLRGLLLWLTTSHLMPAADNYLVARLVNNEAIISVTTVLAHMHCGVECFSYGTTSEELQKTLRALKDLSYFPSVQEDPGSTGHAMAHDTPRKGLQRAM